jgi:hypothetical protein
VKLESPKAKGKTTDTENISNNSTIKSSIQREAKELSKEFDDKWKKFCQTTI